MRRYSNIKGVNQKFEVKRSRVTYHSTKSLATPYKGGGVGCWWLSELQ